MWKSNQPKVEMLVGGYRQLLIFPIVLQYGCHITTVLWTTRYWIPIKRFLNVDIFMEELLEDTNSSELYCDFEVMDNVDIDQAYITDCWDAADDGASLEL